VRTRKEKKTTRSVGKRLSEKTRDCRMLQFFANVRLDESQSDLVKLHAHRYLDIWGTFSLDEIQI